MNPLRTARALALAIALAVSTALVACGNTDDGGLPSGPTVDASFSVDNLTEHWTSNPPDSMRMRFELADNQVLPGDLGIQIEMVAARGETDAVAASLLILREGRVEQELEFMVVDDAFYALPNARLNNWIVVEGGSEFTDELFDIEELQPALELFAEYGGLEHVGTGACGSEECHFLEGDGLEVAVHSGHWIPRYLRLAAPEPVPEEMAEMQSVEPVSGDASPDDLGAAGDQLTDLQVDVIGWDEEVSLAPPADARPVTEDEFMSIFFTLGALQLL